MAGTAWSQCRCEFLPRRAVPRERIPLGSHGNAGNDKTVGSLPDLRRAPICLDVWGEKDIGF